MRTISNEDSWAAAFVRILQTIPVAIAHLFYNIEGGYLLYALSGGIRQPPHGWTAFGGAPFAWTLPLELPVVVLDNATVPRVLMQAWFIAVPLAVGYALVSGAHGLLAGKRLSELKWQIAVAVLGLVWVPVPESWSLVYRYTVLY